MKNHPGMTRVTYCGRDLTRLLDGACNAPDARSAEIYGEQARTLHVEQRMVRDALAADIAADVERFGETQRWKHSDLSEWQELVEYTGAIVYAAERRRRQLIEGDPGEGPPVGALLS